MMTIMVMMIDDTSKSDDDIHIMIDDKSDDDLRIMLMMIRVMISFMII